MIVPVILSGGKGSRLWPLSRENHPKQFLGLVNKTSLFQDTIVRLPKKIHDPFIICNEQHRFIVVDQLKTLNRKNSGILLEPVSKSTAPAIALAALNFIKNSEDPILLILPSDHLIKNKAAFHKAIDIAEDLANKKMLVAFGITPQTPETGYGYIEAKKLNESNYFKINSFTEKPNKKSAEKYLESENYFWNSGMFMFKASTFLADLEKYSPDILNVCQKALNSSDNDGEFIRLKYDIFKECPSNSIDYAVMENTTNGVMIPFEAGWTDIGSWSMLHKAKTKDTDDNVFEGEGEVITKGVKNSYIYSSKRLVTAVNLTDLVIIDTEDILLVLDKKDDQKISEILKKIK